MIFAAVTLLVSGVFQILMGIVALRNRAFFATVGNYTYAVNVHRWGWADIIGGAIVALVGLGLFTGATWARGLGIVIAAASAIGNFFFIPYYPIWTLLVIALDIFVIWSLAHASTEGRHASERQAMEASAPSYGATGGDQRWAATNMAGGYAPSDMSGRREADLASRGTGTAAHAEAQPGRAAMHDQQAMRGPETRGPETMRGQGAMRDQTSMREHEAMREQEAMGRRGGR